jgi:hypothetical protein
MSAFSKAGHRLDILKVKARPSLKRASSGK